jgi:FkbM family methyltransferase
VIGELRDIPSVGRYQLRDSGLLAEVRHPLLDMWVLEEVFRLRVYEPPPAAARALATLERPARIVDLGGHVGYFGLFMRQLYTDASVVSFEPDPRNVEILRRCIEANGLRERWQVIEACAATRDGTAPFQSSFHLSRVAAEDDDALGDLQRRIAGTFSFLEGTALLSPEVHQVAARDAFPSMLDADLIKIDIEGGEWQLLADPRLGELEARAIVLEYHPSYLPGADAAATVALELGRAGYEMGPRIRGGDADMIWAWKPEARSS